MLIGALALSTPHWFAGFVRDAGYLLQLMKMDNVNTAVSVMGVDCYIRLDTWRRPQLAPVAFFVREKWQWPCD